jgi:hypothetical protein
MYTSFFRKAMLGDTATLNLDFTTGVLDSRLTFTRAAGTATYINSSGYVATATTNQPRFDYSPTNIGEPRGLLIEGQTANIATNSTFSSGWSGGVNVTVSANTLDVLDPAGTNTATKCTLTNSTYASKFESFSGLAASTTYTWSYWIRGTAGNQQRIYSATTGTDLVTQSAYTYSTSGWTRVTTTFTTTAVVTQAYVYPISKNTGTGDVIYIWGAQLELGSGASSYIPTVASQVTRNPDYLLSTSSGARTEFSIDDLAAGTSALNAHTVLWTYGRDPNSKRDYPASLYARTNANTERIDLRDFSGTTVEVGTQTRTVQAVTVGTASIVKIALAQSTSAYPSSAINGTSATLTSGVIDSALGLQWVQLCNSSAVASSFNPIWARQLKVYPTALTAGQLQTLTAL